VSEVEFIFECLEIKLCDEWLWIEPSVAFIVAF